VAAAHLDSKVHTPDSKVHTLAVGRRRYPKGCQRPDSGQFQPEQLCRGHLGRFAGSPQPRCRARVSVRITPMSMVAGWGWMRTSVAGGACDLAQGCAGGAAGCCRDRPAPSGDGCDAEPASLACLGLARAGGPRLAAPVPARDTCRWTTCPKSVCVWPSSGPYPGVASLAGRRSLHCQRIFRK
jgi:hypothetical protein